MPRFIINEKMYDTEKMKFIGKVSKMYPSYYEGYECCELKTTYKCKLYKSKNGSFVLVHNEDWGEYYAEIISEKEAKYLLTLYDYDAYVRLFGELEEG